MLRQLIAKDPNNATALNYLGYMLAERGERLDESVDYLKRALAIDPDNGSYLDSIGWAYYKDGKLDLALDNLKQAADQLTTNSVVQDHYGDVLFKLGRLQRRDRGVDARARRRWRLDRSRPTSTRRSAVREAKAAEAMTRRASIALAAAVATASCAAPLTQAAVRRQALPPLTARRRSPRPSRPAARIRTLTRGGRRQRQGRRPAPARPPARSVSRASLGLHRGAGAVWRAHLRLRRRRRRRDAAAAARSTRARAWPAR